MEKIEELKRELKQINTEAGKIRELPVEKRAEFGKRINARRAEI